MLLDNVMSAVKKRKFIIALLNEADVATNNNGVSTICLTMKELIDDYKS